MTEAELAETARTAYAASIQAEPFNKSKAKGRAVAAVSDKAPDDWTASKTAAFVQRALRGEM